MKFKLNEMLPASFTHSVVYHSELEFVKAEAWNIAGDGDEKRSSEEKFRDALKGLSVQHAMGQLLIHRGYEVLPAPKNEKHYDLLVRGNGILDWIKVDVKGRWKKRFFEQTEWEAKYVTQSGDRILYLCIDWMPIEKCFRHTGQCWSNKLSPSQKRNGVPWVESRNFELVL